MEREMKKREHDAKTAKVYEKALMYVMQRMAEDEHVDGKVNANRIRRHIRAVMFEGK